MKLSEELVALLREPSTCYLATTMPDGSPQVTQTWIDTDGEHLLINSVQTHVKTKNIERDARVAVAVSHPDDPSRYVQVRGRVSEITTDGARGPHRNAGQEISGHALSLVRGRDQVRVIFVIEPERVTGR